MRAIVALAVVVGFIILLVKFPVKLPGLKVTLGILVIAAVAIHLFLSNLTSEKLTAIEPDSERRYCTILDKLERDLSSNWNSRDDKNALQAEESNRIEGRLYQQSHSDLRDLFRDSPTLSNWIAKVQPGVSIIDQRSVKFELETFCHATPFITVVSRADGDLVSLLSTLKNGSLVAVSGKVQEIGFATPDWFSRGRPTYITFFLSGIAPVGTDGAVGPVTPASNSRDQATVASAISSSAAMASEEARQRYDDWKAKEREKFLDTVR